MTPKVEKNVFVEVIEISTDKVVERLGPMSEKKVDRVESGIMINMNHDKFFTRIVTE